MNIKLSFCIPTYNRANFLKDTLESIISQATEEIEIVIVDGASTDNTSEIVALFQKQFSNILYHKGIQNMGVDRDMATSVELARGEYCWLMSSDDLVKKDAVAKVLSEIKSEAEIYLCNTTLADALLNPIRDANFLSNKRNSDVFVISDKLELMRYFNFASTLHTLFSYMSVLIFNRNRWCQIGFNESFNGSYYAHVYILFSFVKKKCTLVYIPSPLIVCRGGNDSFSHQGLLKRYLIDYKGYLLLANSLFSHDLELRRGFLNVLKREHKWYRIAKLRSNIRSEKEWEQVTNLLKEFGYKPHIILLCAWLGKNKLFIATALFMNNFFSNNEFVHLIKRKM